MARFSSPFTSPAGVASATLPAIGLVVLATILFTGTNTQAKLLGETLPVVVVVWARFVSHLFVVALIVRGRLVSVLRTDKPAVHWMRSAVMCIGVACYFTGFTVMPLAEAGAVLQLSPLFVTALSVFVLSETVGIRRWSGVFVAFIGALLVIRPGFGGFGWAVLWPLAGAVMYAVYQILTRILKTSDSAMTALCYSGVVGAVVFSCLVPFYWQTPTPNEVFFLIGIGVTGALGHLALIQAYRMIEASLVSPFMYLVLVWMTVSSITVFHDVPDAVAVLGMVMIVGSGAYVAFRERIRSRTAPTAPEASP